MDFGVIIGVLLGFVLIGAGILQTPGGRLDQFSDLGSIFVTVGGAFCAVLVQFPMRDVTGLPRLLASAVFPRRWNLDRIIAEFRRYADVARKNGILALETAASEMRDPFFKRGLQLAVDGTDPRVVEDLMRTDLDQLSRRHDQGIRVVKALAGYSPGFGMIGTLLGLVIMLQNIQIPERVGPAMGLAIITTLYGAVMAYLVFGPIAEKLALQAREEEQVREMVIRGVLGLQSGDNPGTLEQKLMVYLAPGLRQGR